MLKNPLFRFVVCAAALLSLSACESLRRDDAAATAKSRMVGLTKEEILGCMGPPKKKAKEGKTEVWSYLSSDGQSTARHSKFKSTGYDYAYGSRDRSFCTVNVVMKDGVVAKVHYLGPTATNFYNRLDQCGYAVQACVE